MTETSILTSSFEADGSFEFNFLFEIYFLTLLSSVFLTIIFCILGKNI